MPGEHEARRASDEGVELPAAFPQSVERFSRRSDEYSICLNEGSDFDVRNRCCFLCEVPRTGVRMIGISKPRATFDHAYPRSREEPHLGGQLARLFTAVGEVFSET